MIETAADKISIFKRPWLLTLAIIFFILLAWLIVGSIIFEKKFADKIYPNVSVGSLDLGGKTAEEAKALLNLEVDKISQNGIIFSYKNSQAAIKPVVSSPDGSLAYQIITFNSDGAVVAAINYGRDGNFFKNLGNKLLLLWGGKKIGLLVSINQAEIEKILKDKFSSTYEPALDAALEVKYSSSSISPFEFFVSQEKTGKIIDYQEAVKLMIDNLVNLNAQEIKLATITQYPKILSKDCLNISAKAEVILNAAPLTLKYGENKWIIEKDGLSQMLALKLSGSANDKVNVGLDENKFKNYLSEQIAPKIDQAPLEAKFQIQDGKVNEFQNGQDGLALDQDATLAKVENELPTNNQIELVVKVQPVTARAGNLNDLGIKEIIGVGTSNFKGSPVNRRHNIKVGAAAVNGTLIKPGEEFSLLKTLGEVDGSTGYLPELVIKEGKTTPEYGGGLCQIGTTVFRSVIESGLPVTLRRNHSYRVSYYEPAGTDATIYDPWPDFRFINDTANYILIQSKFSGDNLSFEFWGTRDGRVVEKTQPTIYNIVKPQPAKLIETLDLKPGVKKCTESAHNGADAYFDYKVIYSGGAVKQKRFSSHYVPWQEVCLIGVEKLSSPPDIASSTPASIN